MHRYFERDLYRFTDFSGFINEARTRSKTVSSAKAMYNGDMWDKGKGYIGPVPVSGDSNAGEILSNIQRMFTSRNVIEEVVDRQVDALLSKSPDWKIFDKKELKADRSAFRVVKAPRQEDTRSRVQSKPATDKNTAINPKINEAESILSEVWLRGGLGDALKESLTERLVSGRGILRVTLKKTFDRQKDNIESVIDAAKYIKVEHVENTLARVIDDDGEKLSIIQVKNTRTEKIIEISFVNDDNKTVIASIEKGSEGISPQEDEEVEEVIAKLMQVATEISEPLSMNGYITADEILGKPFVSESMLQNNRALNLDLSLGVGVLVESGYSEMVITNVSLETTTVEDPNDSTKTIEVPVGLKRGAGIVNNLVGLQTVNAEGEVQYQNPSVAFKNPTPLTTFNEGERLYYKQILSEAKQTHVLLNADSDPSGESRIQSRQDFVKKSKKYKPTLDIHGTWALNAVMTMCASAAGEDGYFDGIEAIFDSKIYAGELSADEQNVVISQYEHALMSRETAMVLLNIEDPVLELDLIASDEEEKLELQVKRLEATAKFGNMADNGRPPTSEQTKQSQEEKGNTSIRRNRNKNG